MSEQQGRYILVNSIPADEEPYVTKANDFITGSTNGPFIDTGRRVQFMEGKTQVKVYLSVESIREMALTAGLFNALPDEETQDTYNYNEGYRDALKEGLSDDLHSVFDRLGFVADRLGTLELGVIPKPKRKRAARVEASSGDAATPVEAPEGLEGAGAGQSDPLGEMQDVLADADSGAFDTSESKRVGESYFAESARGQGSRARSDNRPVGVSSGSSDGSAILGI